jgi:hypothetical protein
MRRSAGTFRQSPRGETVEGGGGPPPAAGKKNRDGNLYRIRAPGVFFHRSFTGSAVGFPLPGRNDAGHIFRGNG